MDLMKPIQTIGVADSNHHKTKFYIKKTLLICYLSMEAKIDVIKQKTYMNLMEIWLFIRSRPIGKR
jgi:hypothetical protein